jgi:hypothetical protein
MPARYYKASMRCRLFTLLSAFSLAICVGSGMLWGWSNRACYSCYFDIKTGPGQLKYASLNTFCSGFEIGWGWCFSRQLDQLLLPTFESVRYASRPLEKPTAMNTYGAVAVVHSAGGFWYCRVHQYALPDFDIRYGTIAVPWWAILGLTALGPGAWIRNRRGDRTRYEARICRDCVYDLRATPERCPECGTVPISV